VKSQGRSRVQRTPTQANLAWVDLEMTGLDPERDAILQAALIVTTADLEPLEEYCVDVWQPDAVLARMGPFVREMHEKTGLAQRVSASKVELRDAERALLERVSGWCTYPAMLCGNTIGQDRRFIDRYMPALAGYLHYRMIDVSTLKTLARLWYGEPAVFQKPEEGAHDALFDIQQSILELAFYRRSLLRVRDD
jgi:oligoribonuclease